MSLAEDGATLICDGGLPHHRWVLSDGLNAVRLQQEGPPIEMLSAFQRTAGMSSERLFDHGFLDARVAGRRHPFDQVRLTHYGYENHLAADPTERSRLLLCGDRLWFVLEAPGRPVSWLLDDSRLRPWQYQGGRELVRHGWDAAERCVLFQIIDTRTDKRRERPKDYDGFSDAEARDYIGTEWEDVSQGQTAKVATCWVAVGPDPLAAYAAAEVRHEPGSPEYITAEPWPRAGEPQTGTVHTFTGDGRVEVMIGLGSTRQGALAELAAAREGSELPTRRQQRRYAAVAERRPVLHL